jgi:hypothetical protein
VAAPLAGPYRQSPGAEFGDEGRNRCRFAKSGIDAIRWHRHEPRPVDRVLRPVGPSGSRAAQRLRPPTGVACPGPSDLPAGFAAGPGRADDAGAGVLANPARIGTQAGSVDRLRESPDAGDQYGDQERMSYAPGVQR